MKKSKHNEISLIVKENAERGRDNSPFEDPVRFHLNRPQQIVLAIAALLLIALAFVPPWKTVVEGTNQFLGFYPILGQQAQFALGAGSASVTVYTELMALLLGQLVLGSGLLVGVMALTREDWAALLIRVAHDSAMRHSSEIPGLLVQVRDKVSDRVERLAERVDWNLARIPKTVDATAIRPTSMQQHILKRISDTLARGSVSDAETLLLRVRSHAVKQYGEENSFVDELDFRHANLLRDRGDILEAEELYHRCIGRREKLYGDNDLRVATALQSYARLMLTMRRRALATRLEMLASRIREENRRPVEGALPVFGDGPIAPENILTLPATGSTDDGNIEKTPNLQKRKSERHTR